MKVTVAPTDPSTGWREIHAFWFGRGAEDPAEATARQSFWFGASMETDAPIRERFAPAVEQAARGELDGWLQAPRGALSLVLLLDQFPRNMWRGTVQAFSHDARALVAAKVSVSRGHLRALAPVEQAFLILPFQHNESLDDQRESVRLSREIVGGATAEWRSVLNVYLRYAELHCDLVRRFGRFPHRNALLGRKSTAEEEAYLSAGGENFGQGTGAPESPRD